MIEPAAGLIHISGVLGEILREARGRGELRLRLEGEMGRRISDKEFLAIAELTGGIVL